MNSVAAAEDDNPDLRQLTLKAAEALMHRYNRDIKAAKNQLELARSDQAIAAQRPNPTFSYDAASLNPSQGIGAGSLLDKNAEQTIRLEQVFERGDKRGLRVEQASFAEQASRAELVNIVRQQKLNLNTAYADLLLAQEKIRILQEIADLAVRSGDAAERRLRAGDVSKIEAARIRIEGLRAVSDLGTAEAELARARLSLAVLIGAESRATLIRAVDPWPAHGVQPNAPDLEKEIASRPDVRGAQARMRASEAARRLARSSKTRDVTVGVQYKHYPFNQQFGTGSGNTFGLTVSVPLFLWHGNEGEIRKAEAEYAMVRDGVERTRAVAVAELERARSDLSLASVRAARFDGPLLNDARATAEAVEFAYRNGAIGVSDLLDARRTYRALQIEAAVARNDYAKALAAWQLVVEPETDTASEFSH
jgi:cobalt-zinc-cadmium efflux system outer membrane protein